MSTSSPGDALRGSQRPLVSSVPDYVSSSGPEAIELAALAGLDLDPWQKWVLTQWLGEGPDGKWAAFECGLVVPRQNGKNFVVEARELYGLFVLGEGLIVHSAHEYSTAHEHFLRLEARIADTPELSKRVMKVARSHGDEGIDLRDGSRIRFKTRTKGGARGLSADCLILDEAMILAEPALAALMPTVSARDNPQVIYCGSAVDSQVHKDGVVLSRIRERGVAGGDPSLCYQEWSVPIELAQLTESDAGDVEYWAQANPALGTRIAVDHLENERRGVAPRTFAVERLGIGDWASTAPEDAPVIDPEAWLACLDPDSKIKGPKTFGVDIPLSREAACITVAGTRADGVPTVEVVDYAPGVGWVVDRVAELAKEHHGQVVIDDHGPAGNLIAPLEQLRVPLVKLDTAGIAQAAASFLDAVHGVQMRHKGEEVLTAAVASAVKRPIGDRFAWGRRKAAGDVAPLIAASNALYGHAIAPPKPRARVVNLNSI